MTTDKLWAALAMARREIEAALESYVYPLADVKDQPTEWHQAKADEATIDAAEEELRRLIERAR